MRHKPSRTAPGEELRRLRKAAGLTQEALASKVGYVRTMIVEIERGRARPSMDYAARIQRELGLPMEEWADFVPTQRSVMVA
jgi:transcriptional regulator with XRE-family HTH domain